MLNVASGVVEGLVKCAGVIVLLAVLLWYFFPQSRRYLPWAGAALVVALFGAWAWTARPYDRSESLDVRRFNPPADINGMRVSSATYRRIDGVLEGVTLAGNQVIQDMPIQGGSPVTFDDEGHLRSWTASRDVEIWGRKVSAGTGVIGDLKDGPTIALVLPDGSLDHISRQAGSTGEQGR